MSQTITVRLPKELAEWLGETSASTGLPQGRIVRQALENAKAGGKQAFMRLAGVIDGPVGLSARKGFSRK